MTVSDIPYKDFRVLNRLAKNVVPGGLPGANRRFMINACTPEFVDVEAVEAEVQSLRALMTQIEHQVLDLVPATASDGVAKLKFMSSLMLDGVECEVDYFAYLVEECAFVIGDAFKAA